jgi:hypothetical protein
MKFKEFDFSSKEAQDIQNQNFDDYDDAGKGNRADARHIRHKTPVPSLKGVSEIQQKNTIDQLMGVSIRNQGLKLTDETKSDPKKQSKN